MPPDPYDAALSAIRSSVDDLGAWLAIWSARREPDAHARRCASEVDRLLAKTRDGPRWVDTGSRRNRTSASPRPEESAGPIVRRDGDGGRAPEAR